MLRSQIIANKINRQIFDNSDTGRVVKVLKSGFLSKPEGGPMTEEFQALIARAHDNTYAFAVTSGTSALHCAVSALELNPVDEVIVPALANIADCSVVIQEGGTPVFADIDPADFNIDPQDIEAKITKKTRAIIVVHMYGQPAKIDQIKMIAKKHKLILIEDCAQAAGAKYKNRYVGSFGDISCFSLYQTKHIICGEGGVALTSNKKYAEIIASIANNGIMRDDLDAYDYNRIGFNYQMTDMQSALAIGQFKKLDKNNIQRRKNVEIYKSLLSDLDIHFQSGEKNTENSYFYLTGLLPKSMNGKRERFLSIVKQANAPIKKLYPLSLPELTLFKDKVKHDCPVAHEITKRIFNLYVNPGLDRKDIEFIAKAVRKAYKIIS